MKVNYCLGVLANDHRSTHTSAFFSLLTEKYCSTKEVFQRKVKSYIKPKISGNKSNDFSNVKNINNLK